jgi:hypothetical protein
MTILFNKPKRIYKRGSNQHVKRVKQYQPSFRAYMAAMTIAFIAAYFVSMWMVSVYNDVFARTVYAPTKAVAAEPKEAGNSAEFEKQKYEEFMKNQLEINEKFLEWQRNQERIERLEAIKKEIDKGI